MEEKFDVVDVHGNPTWESVSRNYAHTHGVLHRSVHIHFYDMAGNIYFQRRGKKQQLFPDMLHFAVWWHIVSWETLQQTIQTESFEELWIHIDIHDLELIDTFRFEAKYGDFHDNEIAFDYAYCFDGNVSCLSFEDGSVQCIEAMPLSLFDSVDRDFYEKFSIVPYKFYPEIFSWIKNKIS